MSADLTFRSTTFRYPRSSGFTLENLELRLTAGRTILLGPNGAGKSTVLALAASVLRPSAGSVTVGDLDPARRGQLRRYRRRVAWMPQSVGVAPGLTVREHVALHGWLAGMAKPAAWEASEHALESVALADVADQRARALSGGQRARMGLAQALVRDAQVLLLDEPTAALDPDQREAFISLLAGVAAGRTVVVSTHDVSDLADSYDAVVVLGRGQVRFHGSVEAFLRPVGAGAAGGPPVPLSAVQAYRQALEGAR